MARFLSTRRTASRLAVALMLGVTAVGTAATVDTAGAASAGSRGSNGGGASSGSAGTSSTGNRDTSAAAIVAPCDGRQCRHPKPPAVTADRLSDTCRHGTWWAADRNGTWLRHMCEPIRDMYDSAE